MILGWRQRFSQRPRTIRFPASALATGEVGEGSFCHEDEALPSDANSGMGFGTTSSFGKGSTL